MTHSVPVRVSLKVRAKILFFLVLFNDSAETERTEAQRKLRTSTDRKMKHPCNDVRALPKLVSCVLASQAKDKTLSIQVLTSSKLLKRTHGDTNASL